MKKKIKLTAFIILIMIMGCGKISYLDVSSKNTEESEKRHIVDGSGYKIGMITDTGGINDQSFNQGAWEGLEDLSKKTGAVTSYIQSKQVADFVSNLEILIDDGNTLCWGIGYACADSILEVSKRNPSICLGIIDSVYPTVPENVACVMFKGQEGSFLAGYVAASFSKTNNIGFIGGIPGEIIDQFHYGYLAGVEYFNTKHKTEVKVHVQYADSFSDVAKGKGIATKMYSQGCDVVFHAAGGTGVGVIEAAKENGKYVIGADRDQSYLAPDNVLTSVLKKVSVVIEDISIKYISGEPIGGKVFEYGIKQDAVGLTMDNILFPESQKDEIEELKKKIITGEITPPKNKREYEKFYSEKINY